MERCTWHFPKELKRSTPHVRQRGGCRKTKERKYWQDYFMRSRWDRAFRLHRFLFQTNSRSRSALFHSPRIYPRDDPDMLADKTVYDPYSGTGTICTDACSGLQKVVGGRSLRSGRGCKENANNHLGQL